MLAQHADLSLFALISLRLISLRPYVPATLCLRPHVLCPFVCALMSGFALNMVESVT